MIAQSIPIMPGAWEWAILLWIGLVLFGLPAIILLVVLAVLLRRSRTARRVLLNLGAGVLALIFVVFILRIGAHRTYRTGPVPVAESSLTIEPAIEPLPSASIPERNGRKMLSQRESDRELPFEPDVYASKASAVRAAAKAVAHQYEQRITSEGQRPKTVQVSDYLGADRLWTEPMSLQVPSGPPLSDVRFSSLVPHRQLLSQVALETARTLGASQATVTSGRASLEAQVDPLDDPQAVELEISLLRTASVEQDSEQPGLLRVTLAGPLGRFSREAAFVDKPWSEDFESWRILDSRVHWVKGESDSLCVTADEARAQAMADAARKVVEMVIVHGESRHKDTFAVHARRDGLASWLGEVVPRWLATGQLQSDTFVQEYERPYGTLYSCAMRVRVPPEKADTLLDAYFSYDRGLRASWLRATLSAAGLLVLIGVVYLFLNAATRGYYVGSVRIAAVVMAAFGAWCVLMLM